MTTSTAAPSQHRNAGKAWGRPFAPGKSGNPAGSSAKQRKQSAEAEHHRAAIQALTPKQRRMVRATAQAHLVEAQRELRTIVADRRRSTGERLRAAKQLAEAAR